jgi:UDP-glucose 4-epimerase
LTRSLVTGGAGFIGSNLVDALIERGDEVTILDDLSGGRLENVSAALDAGARLVRADIRDGAAVEQAFADARPEVVFHLAAQISVRRSIEDPVADAETNAGGTVRALEASRRAGVRRFVNASTGGPIYGPDAPRPTPESEPPRPKSPYGQSKLAGEEYCDLYARVNGVPTISLRCGNVYGPRQDPRGEAGVVAIFCGRILRGETATIFGDGRQERDFVYVGEVVGANLAAADSEAGGAFNIGTGRGSSVLDLVGLLERLTGSQLGIEHAPPRLGESRCTALDPTRAGDRLGWRPKVGLEEGLRRTLRSLGWGVI